MTNDHWEGSVHAAGADGSSLTQAEAGGDTAMIFKSRTCKLVGAFSKKQREMQCHLFLPSFPCCTKQKWKSKRKGKISHGICLLYLSFPFVLFPSAIPPTPATKEFPSKTTISLLYHKYKVKHKYWNKNKTKYTISWVPRTKLKNNILFLNIQIFWNEIIGKGEVGPMQLFFKASYMMKSHNIL